MSSTDLDKTLDQLNSSLDELEAALAPLQSQSLEETLASLDGPIQRAKILFWVAYTIHSCSWVHAKTRGADIESIGVLEELKRIQPYNGKITVAAASGSKQAEEEPRNKIDKGAASRFIKAAISNQPKKAGQDSSFYTAKSSVQDPLDGPGKHSRLKSIANSGKRGTDDEESSSSSEDEDLKVHGDGSDNTAQAKGKRKKREEAPVSQGKKRKWTPEGDAQEATSASNNAATTTETVAKQNGTKQNPLQGSTDTTGLSKNATRKKKRQQLEQESSASASASAAPSPAPSVLEQSNAGEAADGSKKKKKKNNKKQDTGAEA